jgi:AcrR family transcriptional regulator
MLAPVLEGLRGHGLEDERGQRRRRRPVAAAEGCRGAAEGRVVTGLERAAAKGGARQSAKAARRQELIEATIDSLAKRGYEATTLADVAEGAGLSRGIVNFHFETKEKLLVETLRHLSTEYRGHWRGALAAAGDDPAARLWALVSADFDRKVCATRKLAAWCAFWGEAKSRPTYREHCSANDEEYQSTVVGLCARLAAPGQDAPALARAIVCLLEGLWLNLMMAPKDFRREQALACARTHLATVFPRHFTADGPIGPAAADNDTEEPVP